MIKLGELDTSLEDVNGYLQQVEDELSELDHVHGDPKYLETHIKKLKVNSTALEIIGKCVLVIEKLVLVRKLFCSIDVLTISLCSILDACRWYRMTWTIRNL